VQHYRDRARNPPGVDVFLQHTVDASETIGGKPAGRRARSLRRELLCPPADDEIREC